MPENKITIAINGDSRDVPGGLTVEQLLDHLGIESARVAIERNLDILPRDRWAETLVQFGDRFEIIHFVGGG